MHLKPKIKGFALIEIIVVVVIVGILSALIIPRIPALIAKAGQAEGMENLGGIRNAELTLHQLSGQFQTAEDHSSIQSTLGLMVGGRFYTYKVIEASEDDFLALAIPNWPYSQWLEQMAINKDGFVSSPSPYYGSAASSGSSGGGGGGGSGSGGGGGSGIGGGGGGGGSGGGISVTQIGGGVSVLTFNNLISNPLDIPAPVNVIATSNDGWITLGWPLQFSNFYYRIFASDSEEGDYLPADPVFDGTAIQTTHWEEQVANGQARCYKLTAVFFDSGNNAFESAFSDPQCTSASATSAAALAVQAGITELATAVDPIVNVDGIMNGNQIATFINDDNTTILFGTGPNNSDSLAFYNPSNHTITVDISFQNSPPEVVAAIISHEMLHRTWDFDFEEYEMGLKPEPTYGMPIPGNGIRSQNSLDQEYRAFLTAGQIWHELKGGLTQTELDAAEAVVLESDGSLVPEAIAKFDLQTNYYPTLADY